jgi:4-hydroxy-3-methylbut-2-enyl diphosphate reductase
VRSAEEAADLPHVAKLGVVVQTTQTLARLQELVAALVGRARELRVFNTICGATAELQEAALELAREVDVMVVVGGRNSANTARLRLLSESAGIPAHHIETADELRPEWFAGKPTVGVTAGASTPQWLIDDVVGRLRQMGDGAGS